MSQLLQSSAPSLSADAVASAASAPVDSVHLHVDDARRTNRHTILCKFCDTKVLTPHAATYEQREVR